MKIAFLALLPCLILAKPSGLPQVTVKETRTFDGIPSIDIVFPNGNRDNLVLERHYMSEADKLAKKMHCNFIGHLEKESDACVAVTGCPGDTMEFTINSNILGHSNRFILHKNGEMELVESPFKDIENHAAPKEIPIEMRLDQGWSLVDGDELENADQMAGEMAWEANCAAGQCTSLPETNLMKVKVGYDDTFYADSGYSQAEASAYLDSMFTHVQTFFCHPTLGSKIQIQRDGGYTYHSGNTWKADPDFESLDGPIMDITSSSSSNAHLFVYMCKDPEFYGTIGLAWVGTICGPNSWKGLKASINEKRENAVATAEVVAHEMGHNMGMWHDFDNSHGGSNSPCNGEGIMSYGDVPQRWSTCSQADYLARYNQVGGNNWCMAAAPGACGSTPPPPGPPPTGGCVDSWIGDNYCDDENNVPECDYDGGDCCGDNVQTTYCSVCECLEGGCVDSWIGDNYCDDENNNAGCNFDGGDCCGDDVKTTYCTVCECLEPTTTTTTTEEPTGGCVDSWIGDNYCDDENNVPECDYDGGDCCGDNVQTTYCSVCECLEGGCVDSWIGDNYCDDENNNPGCNFDGGDCCGDNVDKTYCDLCECFEECKVPQWEGDGWCDDENNHAGCTYDGGDCCGDDVKTTYCQECQCLDPNFQ